MKEITRIHIAKVAYDIETAAKKELEAYITTLGQYAEDDELLQDIEIRITELLAERGIVKDGVITHADVKAIRQQLGEPEEFMGDGDIAVGPSKIEAEVTPHRLYRDVDMAVLGGVLSGISSYFKINPLWLRLVFIVLLFMSFGTVVLVYLVLWVAIPPARTAAEKLQLVGKPVTLGSIRELNASEETGGENLTAKNVQRALSIGLGIVALVSAIATLAFTVWATILLTVTRDGFAMVGLTGDTHDWFRWIVVGLLSLSGLLLTALLSLIAFIFLRMKVTKRLVIVGVIIILAGIITTGAAMGTWVTQSLRLQTEAQQAVRTTTTKLPTTFASTIKEVHFDAVNAKDETAGIRVEYVVTDQAPHYTFTALPGLKPVIKQDGSVATVSLTSSSEIKKYGFAAYQIAPTLTFYGPALDKIEVSHGSVTYSGKSQETFSVNTKENASAEVTGKYATLTATAASSSDIALRQSSIDSLIASVENDARVTAGTVRALTATQPGVCPDNDTGYQSSVNTRIVVRAVTSETITLNGAQRPAKTIESSCAVLIVGDETQYDSKQMQYNE